jgi:hypothetical protein
LAQILPRFYQARVDIGALKQMRAEVDAQPAAILPCGVRLPGYPDALRGLPVVGRQSRGGHIRGTRPDQLELD